MPTSDVLEVLHLIDTYRVGGPGKTIINSARFIDRARFRVHVASFTHPEAERNEFTRAVRAAGIPYLELPETSRINIGHVGVIRQYVRERRIDIVHAHGYRTDVLSYLATRALPVTLVTTHHGWIRNSWRDDLMARLALQLCRRFDGVEVVSRKLLDELPASVKRAGRAAVVHNGIVTEDYQPAGRRSEMRRAMGLTDDDQLLGVVGRLSIEKGCLDLLDALAVLAQRHPRVHLAFAGEGPLEMDLRARAHALSLEARVHYLGHQSPVAPFYEAVDVLVSPSHTEGLSNAILEGLTTCRPIVATRVGGTPEILDDGVTALLVPAQDPAAMAAALGRVLTDGGLRQSLVAAGRERIQAEFTFHARMRKEEQFYDRIRGHATP